MANKKEYAYGKAQKPTHAGPKLKGWIRFNKDNFKELELDKFYDFTLWPSKTHEGAYDIRIEEQWKKPEDDYVRGSQDAISAQQIRNDLDDEIPF